MGDGEGWRGSTKVTWLFGDDRAEVFELFISDDDYGLQVSFPVLEFDNAFFLLESIASSTGLIIPSQILKIGMGMEIR